MSFTGICFDERKTIDYLIYFNCMIFALETVIFFHRLIFTRFYSLELAVSSLSEFAKISPDHNTSVELTCRS